ncbi:MAG TPA: hypothetical protein VFE78_04225 [Gemmataceae bacterium]|nr:hypothetical protein [Gemmataceae bacterium]
MGTINCYIPIRVRITGRPSDAQLDELGEALARALTERLTFAERIVASRHGPGARAGAGPVEVAREPFDPARFDVAQNTYTVPSYDGVPKPLPVQQADPGTITRIEIFLHEKRMRVLRDGGRPPLFFTIQAGPDLKPGQLFAMWKNGSPHITTGKNEQVVVSYIGTKADNAAFEQMLARAQQRVPVQVYGSAKQTAPPAGAAEGGDEHGEVAEPLHGDEGIMAGNAALAGLYLDFLVRFAAVRADKAQAAHGLSADQVKALAAINARARAVTSYFTQGWKEYRKAGESDLNGFGALEEALLTQWDRGNATAQHNLLEIKNDREGLGLYKRGTIFRYYGEGGEPVQTVVGGYRDPGYRSTAPPSFALNIPVTDPGLLQVLGAIKNVTFDEQVEIYQSAKGYVDNGDLLLPAVSDGWDKWGDLEKELKDQAKVLVVFLGAHLVAVLFERFGSPLQKAIGLAIDGILRVAGRYLGIIFAGQLLVLALRCGRELSLIRREEGKPLDALSRRHLSNAALLMRRLLTEAVAAGLTFAAMGLARAGKVALGEALSEGGGGGKGGGGLGGLELATEAAGGRGGRGPVRGDAAAAAAEAAGGSKPPARLPTPLPLQMAKAPEGKSDQPAAGAGGGGTPGGGTPGVGRRRIIPPRQPAQTGGGGGEPGAGGEPPPAEPAARPEEGGRPETGAERERREMEADRPQRPPNSAAYFSWEGGQARSWRGFRNDLNTHRRALTRSGQPDPAPNLNDGFFDQDAETFIRNNPALNRTWSAWRANIETRLRAFERQRVAARGDSVRLGQLESEQAAIDKRIQKLLDFGKGKVGDKRPDLVELFFPRRRGVVTDVTEVPGDPLHNFKTRFYIEVLKALTGWGDVEGIDFKDVNENTPFP